MATASKIQDFDDPKYDPFAVDALNYGEDVDPYPQIHKMRERGNVIPGSYRDNMGAECYYNGFPKFSILGRKEGEEVLTDGLRFSNSGFHQTIGSSFGLGSLTALDNPEHGRWRRIFQKIFLPQYVKTWGQSIVDPAVNGLMEKFIHRGEADLVEEFTLLYPFEVIYRQLDLPAEDIHTFQRLAMGQTDFANMDRAAEAGTKLGEYFRALIDERRANPGVDLISMLATVEVDGEHLPEHVLLSFLRQLMNAAGDTTYRGTSALLVGLLQNPDQLEAVRLDRTLIADAIEEALRWEGPIIPHLRVATVDTMVGGVAIPAGSSIDVIAGGLNRDPAIYPDPDTFNIFRERRPHYSFARGPHICIGQHLARVEMTRALHAILDNLQNLRLDPEKPAPELRGVMMRVPSHIYVRFDPR